MDKLEIAKAKELRGDIIVRLYTFYGEDVALATLRNLLRYKNYNSENDIARAVNYLSGAKKEYISFVPDAEDFWSALVQLTPAGVNLAEGDITDMGVLIDE